jgi:hypothetical protein
MKRNIGSTEKWIRLSVGIILVLAGLFGELPPWGMEASIGLGAIAIITGAINFCPLWAVLGVNTRRT